ncbi:MAG TPA: glycosyltransferase [Anaerolineaceae bacterium]|nr:glycosyltransferase [Anaerolineaceae bacterium]
MQVTPFFSPKMGGSVQVVYHISRELAEQGHDVTVVSGDFGIKNAAFPLQAFKTVILPSPISRWGFYITPGLIPWMHKHIKEFDIIHLHEARTFQNFVARWFAVRAKVPYVLSAHGTLPIIVQRQFFKRVYDLFFGKKNVEAARYLVAVSPTEALQYRQAGIENDRIRTIYNGINLEEFLNLPAKGAFRRKIPGLNTDTRIILYLGRLHQRKGINFLLEAIAQLLKRINNLVLAIVGPDDGDQANLQSLTKSLNIEKYVKFAGPLYGQDKLAALQDADILVYPAVYEIFGLVPFEALMCSTPVIVADDCGLGQLIRESGAGYLVRYGNVPALVESLQFALLNPEDAQQKVKAGQAFIHERLDWKNIVNQLIMLYQHCINY